MDIPRLHPDTLEEVKQRVDIVDVISEHIVLKKRGKDYVGLCPFHDEKTPSFSVSSGKQLYYCFGCGEGGNAIKFLMELGKRSFSDVVLDLARRYQVSIKTLEPEQRQELQRQLSIREQLYEILALTASFYEHALYQSQGETALNYLKQERHLKEDIIQQFQLGYAPAGWEILYGYLVEEKRYPLTLVEEAGLIKPRKNGSGYYDLFRDRLMIPILDTQGRVIGFGSRTLADEEPKYLNSPETLLFNKSNTLFAFDKAKNSIRSLDKAIVVEGYFDAIALHAAGITNVVASLGTAFTQSQLRQLLKYTESKQVIFNFDGDAAGTKATLRAINDLESLVYSGQVQLRVLNLPEGKDADEFLRTNNKGIEIYHKLIENAPLWLDWQIQQIVGDRDLKQADQFQQVAQQMVKILGQISDYNQRNYYINHCANLLAQVDSRLGLFYAKKLKFQVEKPQQPSNQSGQKFSLNLSNISEDLIFEEAEGDLLRVYIHYAIYRQQIVESLEEKDIFFTFYHHRWLWQEILKLQTKNPELIKDDSNQLLSSLQHHILNFPELQKQVESLLYIPEKIKLANTKNAEKAKTEKTEQINWEDPQRIPLVIRAAIISIEKAQLEKYSRFCYQRYQEIDQKIDSENSQYYFQEYFNTKQKLMKLETLRHVSQLTRYNQI